MSINHNGTNPHFAVRLGWLAQHEEAPLDPHLPIIDCHHHLWDRKENKYLFFDFLEDINSGHDIRASIFMECGAMYRQDGPSELRPVGETEFANGAAAMSASGGYGDCRICAGIVGSADLLLGDRVMHVLEEHIAAGRGRFRGVRQISAWHPNPGARGSLANPPPGLLGQPQFRHGLAAVGRLQLSFDAYMYHTQLGELAEVATLFPDIPIILNHVGGPIGIGPYAGRRDEVFLEWALGIRELARRPNVHIKLSGLGMRVFGFGFGENRHPPTSVDLASAWAPYVLECIEAFGVRRCMFGSNFPVDKGSCSYNVLWNSFKRITSGATLDETTALFSGTAAQVYRVAAQSLASNSERGGL